MPQDNNDILRAINDLQNTVKDLNYQITYQNRKIRELDSKFSALKSSDFFNESGSILASPPPPPPPPPSVTVFDRQNGNDLLARIERINSLSANGNDEREEVGRPKSASSFSLDKTGDVGRVGISKKDPADRKEEVGGSLEERIGGRWFAKIGMAVVILGLSFFLKYAFDNNWIGPGGRVLIGLFCGLVLLSLGEKFIRRYFLYGQILSGGGLAALYLSIYAALNFYGLIDPLAAFAFMAVVSAIAIALSLRYDAQSLIVVALLGGFATPFLVSTDDNLQVGLFSYVILLDLAVLYVSIFKNWRWLQLGGFFGTYIIFQSWYQEFYTVQQLFSTLFFLTVFFVIYSLSALFYNLIRKEGSSGYEQLLAMFSGLAYFGAAYTILNDDFHDLLGVLAVVLAVYYFLWAYLAKELTPKDENIYNFLAFLCIGFVTIAIPIQFKAYTVTISWLVEAVLLIYLGAKQHDAKGDILKVFGFFIYFLAVGKIFIDSTDYVSSDWLFANKFFAASLVAIASAYFTAGCYKNFAVREDESKYSTVSGYRKTAQFFMVVASLLTIFAVSRDLSAWHKKLINKEYEVVSANNHQIAENYGLNFESKFKQVNMDRVNLLEERSEVLISIFIIVYCFFIIGWGLLRDYLPLVYTGIIINFLVLLKFFFSDLWEIKSAYRTLLSLSAVVGSYFNALLFSGQAIKIIDFKEAKRYMLFFVVIANILTVFFVSREISVYYEKIINAAKQEEQVACRPSGKSIYSYRYSEGGDTAACNQYYQKIKKLNNQASVSISIFWLFYAIILVAIGFAKRLKGVRLGGMALLLVAIAKLFFVDLWSLGQLYRIVASISLGVVLLGISFAYQKYRDVFKEIIA